VPKYIVITDSPVMIAIVMTILKETEDRYWIGYTEDGGNKDHAPVRKGYDEESQYAKLMEETPDRFGFSTPTMPSSPTGIVTLNRPRIVQCLSYILIPQVVELYLDMIQNGVIKVNYTEARNNSISGQHDASWLGYYHFLNRVMGVVKETEQLEGMWELALYAHWTLVYDSVCIVSHRPTELYLDDQNRLHNEHGPAFNFNDDWKEYYLHNIPVDSKFIETPEKASAQEIISFSNAEVRRVLMRLYGEDKILTALKAKIVDVDEKYGVMYKADLPDTDEPLIMVKVENSTPDLDGKRKYYYLSVQETMEDSRGNTVPIDTVQRALKWVAGMPADADYSPAGEA
jgi:hypothetical protein